MKTILICAEDTGRCAEPRNPIRLMEIARASLSSKSSYKFMIILLMWVFENGIFSIDILCGPVDECFTYFIADEWFSLSVSRHTAAAFALRVPAW